MTEQANATANAADNAEDNTQDISSLTNLDDVFDESDATDTADEAEQVADDEKGETEGEGTETKEKEPETKVEASPASESEAGLKAALAAERTKRQKAEDELRRAKEEKTKVPDPVEDPEGYAKYLETRNDQSSLKSKVDISRELMLETKDDFVDMEKVFMGLVADAEGNVTDESLLRKFQSSPNPAKFAYNHAKEHLEVQRLRDPKYKESLEAEIREKVRKELEAEYSVKGGKKPRSATEMPDLTNATASGNNSTPVGKVADLNDLMADSPL